MSNPMFRHSTDAGWVSRSHRSIARFRLVRPETVADAVAVLAGDNAVAIAGGIDLVRRMRAGDAHDTLVDLSRLSGLRTIADDGDAVRIGALATHWDIETSTLLGDVLPAFRNAWTTIGNVRIRMAGTVGGNLMAGEAGYDGRVLLGAAGATLVFLGSGGEVRVSAASPSAAWPRGALLTGTILPKRSALRIAFDRTLKPVVSVAVAIDGDVATVGAGCAYAEPQFASGPPADVAALAAGFPEPRDNPMGSSAYRRRMIGVLARRLLGRLQGGDRVG
jgi:carbon-monoxide dehydrogenase medium subunit